MTPSADFTDIDPLESTGRVYTHINERVNALRSMESASAFPTDTVSGQFVFRSDTGWVFQRNQADDAWIAMWEVDNAPWSPLLVELNTFTKTSWVATTDLDDSFDDEGVDLFIPCQMVAASQDLTIKIPDIAAWQGRKVWVSMITGFNGKIVIQNESDDSVITEIHQPSDWVLLQNQAGSWFKVAGQLRGSEAVTSSLSLHTSSEPWKKHYYCDATSGAIVITLPAIASTAVGFDFPLLIKKTDASGNSVTLSGSANIDGAATKVLSSQWDYVWIQPDPLNTGLWQIVG